MGNRNIENTAERVREIMPYNLTMTLGELEQVRQLAQKKDPIELIGVIFRFGFAVGHRAARAGKVKGRV